MFRAGLLLIIRRYYCIYKIRRYYSVYTAISIGHAYTNCCIYVYIIRRYYSVYTKISICKRTYQSLYTRVYIYISSPGTILCIKQLVYVMHIPTAVYTQ